jgi:hypothetical protein
VYFKRFYDYLQEAIHLFCFTTYSKLRSSFRSGEMLVCTRAYTEVPAQYTKQEHGADTQAFSPAVLARGTISYGGPACTEQLYYGAGLVSGILRGAGTVSQFRPRWFYLLDGPRRRWRPPRSPLTMIPSTIHVKVTKDLEP